MERKDTVVPGEKWQFDGEVASVFDDMLERSIPGYAQMRELTFRVASTFLDDAPVSSEIVDLGTSRGGALQRFVDRYGARFQYWGVEISEPMAQEFENRFRPWIERGHVHLERMDLRELYPPCRPVIVLAILSIQFTPIEYRHQIMSRIYDSLLPGGALLMVEKTIGANALLDEKLTKLYYDMKRAHGYTEDQIWRKRKSLEGVLVPLTERHNLDGMRSAGFKVIECYWRCLQFAGWVAIK